MCGIAGVVAAAERVRAEAWSFDGMVDAMRARGPDDRGVAASGRTLLGARRLAIIDCEHGAQPVASEDGAVVAVLNGELYTHVELREELRRRGHRFHAGADTEVLVHGYEEWGIHGLLERLNGMFAFALHDRREDRVWIARDRLGIKPLLYAETPEAFLFASSSSALLASGRIDVRPDPEGVRLYLHNHFVPAPWTVLEGVRKLPPGTCLEIVRGRPGAPQRYWGFPSVGGGDPEPGERGGRSAPGTGGRAQAAPEDLRSWGEELRERLSDAVRIRLRADMPVGVFLSGGLDSSILLSLIREHSPLPVDAFVMGVESGSGYDETEFAELAADRFGARLHARHFGVDAAVGAVSDVIDGMEEPIGDPACLPTYLLSGLARERVKVVLAGEGADELFAGYMRYRRFLRSWGRARHGLEPLRRGLNRVRARGVVALATQGGSRSAASAYPHPLPAAACECLLEGLGSDRETGQLQQAVEWGWVRSGSDDALGRALTADASGWLPDNLLAKVDRMSMAHGLEARVPFLDHRVVELAMRIPSRFKCGPGVGKIVLREAFAERLGERLARRGKHGFDLPMDDWMRGAMRPLVSEWMRAPCAAVPWLAERPVRGLVEAHLSGEADLGRQVWMLLVLATWFGRATELAAAGRARAVAVESGP